MDIGEFASENAPDESPDQFELENSKLLDIDVDGSVMAKAGSMIGYTGDLSFTGVSSAEGGFAGYVKEKMTGEGTDVMEVEGQGHLYLADQAKEIQILELGPDEQISVNGNDVLAFESRIDYEVSTLDSIAGITTGGLTNVFLTGPGNVAITTHGDPLVLEPPVKTDPAATVAWTGDLSPGSSTDYSLRDTIGQSSGESYQLEFSSDRESGDGVVIVQPFEEVGPQQ